MRVCSASRVARHTITRKHPAAPPPLVAPPHTVSRSNHVATAFRRTPGCEVLVYYPIEKRGSCVLCKDLHTFAKTAPDAQTRAYLTTPAPPPLRASASPRDQAALLVDNNHRSLTSHHRSLRWLNTRTEKILLTTNCQLLITSAFSRDQAALRGANY